jgi:ribose-phosphate pyrophosphokinase
MRTRDFALFSGSASDRLAESIGGRLNRQLSASAMRRFPDGELAVTLEESVRGRAVFVVQSTYPAVTESLFELLLYVDACRRAGARQITAVVPYLGYARADKRHARREAITASMLANLFGTAGLDQLVTIDLHSPQIEGFYNIPVESLTAVPTLCDELGRSLPSNTVVVSPDEGRVQMAREFGRMLNLPIAVLHKLRASPTETKVLNVIGDVRGCACLIIDDMITTGGTIASAVAALLKAGASPEITVAATHGVLVEGAREQLSHPSIRRIVVTDSIAQRHSGWDRLTVVSVAPMLAAAIQRLSGRESMCDFIESESFCNARRYASKITD